MIGTFPKKSKPTVYPEVGKFTRVCACDRPGTPVGEKPSRSDSVPQPTTAKDAVADLHALLSAAGEAGPYVLVGHSYGGLIVRLYASIYPKEVSGLVLVDALSDGLQDAETPQQWAIQRKLIEGDVHESVALYPALERIDVDRSFNQIRAAPSLRSIPLVVLSADRPWGPQVPPIITAGKLPADIPPDFGYVTDAAQKKAQERLAKLVPNEKHITNTNSGHEIHKEQPQLVIDAIREVVEARPQWKAVADAGRYFSGCSKLRSKAAFSAAQRDISRYPVPVRLRWMALIFLARARARFAGRS